LRGGLHEELTDFQGPFMTTKAFLPALDRAPEPRRIINVSSDFASISSECHLERQCWCCCTFPTIMSTL
jgi:short-subunit dehydrogenase involved in D-alanine esterification of teichoic acids